MLSIDLTSQVQADPRPALSSNPGAAATTSLLLCPISMAPSKNIGKARVGGKPSAKAKSRQIHKKTSQNYPGRFNGAGIASVKAKNLQVDKKTTSSQKSKSHDDHGGGTSRKEAQAGIWKQQPHDDIPDVIMNNNKTQHDIPPHDNRYNFTPSKVAEIAEEVRLYVDINDVRCMCRGSNGLSSCPGYRPPRCETFYDDDDDTLFFD